MPKIKESQRLETKVYIMDVASRLFSENGYNSTSVNDIIKKADMSKGRFYTYYDSKEALFFDLISRVDSEIRQVNQVYSGLDQYIEYRLRRLFDEKNKVKAKYATEFWSSIEMTQTQSDMFNARFSIFKEDIKSIIQDGQNRGVYKHDIDLDIYLQVFMSSLDGIIIMDSVLNQSITPGVIEMTINIFCNYLKEATC